MSINEMYDGLKFQFVVIYKLSSMSAPVLLKILRELGKSQTF